MHDEDPPADFDPRTPFARADGLAAGLTGHQLRGPDFTRVFHDVYVCASVTVTTWLRATVALDLCGPGGHISHHTAAKIWKAWVPDDAETHISVRRREDRRKRDGIRCHLAHPMTEVRLHRGRRVASPAQTFLDMATCLGLVDLVVLGDSLVHRGLVTPAGLREAAASWPGRRALLARRAADLVRAGVDSPMETRLRLLLVLGGLPEPEIAHEIIRTDGRRRIRFDLSYPGLRLAIEYDGRQHAHSTDQWLHDIDRREDLDHLRWRLVIVTSDGIYVEPEVTLERVRRALHELGATHLRVRADDEWRRHFPGRPRAAA